MNIGFSKCSHKINMLCLLIFFCAFLSSNRSDAENKKENALENNIFHEKVNKLSDEVKEIRRDQLNYKIEKDLLKETYAANYQTLKESFASNYQTISIIIALIMAFITIIGTILGYIGFNGISNIKKEYENELQKLRDIKEGFESKLKELVSTQLEVKGKLESVSSINEEQNKKIQLLELKEKANSYIRNKDYQRAIEYIDIGVDISPNDVELLILKSGCLSRLAKVNYPESIAINKKILSIDPNNKLAINNLAELFLFEEKFDSYEELIKDEKAYFVSDSDALMIYLESLKSYMKNEGANLISLIDRLLQKQHFQSKEFFRWDFDDLEIALTSKPASREKDILMKFTRYLKGSFDGMELKKMLDNPSHLAT